MPPIEAPAAWADPAVLGLAAALVVLVAVVVLARKVVRKARADAEVATRRAQREHERAEALATAARPAATQAATTDVRTERTVLEGVTRAVREMAAAATREDVALALGRAVQGTIAPKQWMVFLAADAEGKEFVVAASGCEGGSRVWKPGARLSSQTGKVGLVVRRRASMDRHEFDAEPPIVREQVARTEPGDFHVELAVPVLVGEKVVSVVTCGGPEPLLTIARLSLELLAQSATVVLRGLAARERAERIANQDTLTGVGNKSWFNASAAEDVYRIRQEGGVASLVLLGIDDFAHYVRRHGRGAGDKLVRGIAQVLRPLARDGELLARWTEDEFAVLLPDSDLTAGWAFAAKARKAVAAVDWPHADGQPGGRVTLCAGIACFPGSGDSLEALLEAAGAALGDARARDGGGTTGSILIEPSVAASLDTATEVEAAEERSDAGRARSAIEGSGPGR